MTVRFGLVGTGYWADHTHAAGLAGHPHATLHGVWGRDAGKAAALADRYGAVAFTDLDTMLVEVDAVTFAVPPHVQAELAVRAARAGKHLLLDKPVALTVDAADVLARAVDDAGVASLVFVTARYFDNVAAFLAETAAVGGWAGAEATLVGSIFQPGNPYGASPWRRERGGLWDVGPHALAGVLPVLGPVARVRAVRGPHDTVHALLEHTGGAVSTLALSVAAPPAMVRSGTVFFGDAGIRRIPDGDGDLVTAFRAAVSRLVSDAAAGTRSEGLDVHSGRYAVAVLTAVERAARDGTSVRLPAAG